MTCSAAVPTRVTLLASSTVGCPHTSACINACFKASGSSPINSGGKATIEFLVFEEASAVVAFTTTLDGSLALFLSRLGARSPAIHTDFIRRIFCTATHAKCKSFS